MWRLLYNIHEYSICTENMDTDMDTYGCRARQALKTKGNYMAGDTTKEVMYVQEPGFYFRGAKLVSPSTPYDQ